MNALAQRIARLIDAQGPIAVAQFMAMALHDPEYGVYGSRNPVGRGGDFITAPEISQIFGELLGLWCVAVWRDQGAPFPARLVELGPGRGTLMADALRAARLDPEFQQTMEVVLVESSAPLQALQAETLKASAADVRWSPRLDAALLDRPLFLVANEFFDALPIRQFVKRSDGWHERMVTHEAGALAFAVAPIAATGLVVPEARGPAADGAVFEIAPAAIALAEEIGQAIATRGGAALIVDYGYGAGAGFGETFQALGRHRTTNILDAPGAADLSAHVDFAALADAARRGGAAAFGPIGQGAFLNALGIAPRGATLAASNPDQADTIAATIHRLTHSGSMGQLFKVLAILPPLAAAPPGF